MKMDTSIKSIEFGTINRVANREDHQVSNSICKGYRTIYTDGKILITNCQGCAIVPEYYSGYTAGSIPIFTDTFIAIENVGSTDEDLELHVQNR